MDVRTGLSYWQAIGPPAITFPPLQDDRACEVLVVGGGITGALVSHYLIAEGVETVLIDRDQPGVGSTAASTGLLQYEIDTPLIDLARKVGESRAVHAYRSGLSAIDQLEGLVANLGYDDQPHPCGFSRRRSLYFASRWWHRRRVEREFEMRRRYGFAVDYLTSTELAEVSTIHAPCAIRSSGDAQIDAYQFTQKLLTRSAELGLAVFGETKLIKLDETSEGVIAQTAEGRVRARRVVYATGYESGKHLSRTVGRLLSTYVLVSEPTESFAGWPEGQLIWESARPYFYARQTDDGRAIIGGQDTAYSDDHEDPALTQRQFIKLQCRFTELFPQISFTPAFGWAGTFGETKDGMAYIGIPPGKRHSYFALGYGGNGITFSIIAARLIADLYLGRKNPDAEVFAFERP